MRFSACFVLMFILYGISPAFAGPASPLEAPNPENEAAVKNDAPENKAPKEEKGEGNNEGSNDGSNEAIQQVNRAWDTIWLDQREMIKEIRDTAATLGDEFAQQTKGLTRKMQPYEDEGRRLLVFANTFNNYPNAMEAVYRRLGDTISHLEGVLQPVNTSRKEAQGLLERINYMSASLPEDADKNKLSPEMREYISAIIKARMRLTALMAQYDSLLPALSLVKQLEESRQSIARNLPELWKDYYMQPPVSWLSPTVWENVFRKIRYAWRTVMLRLPVEMPTTAPQWGTAVLRFFIGLFFAGILSILLRERWKKLESTAVGKHIFRVSIPWLVLGFALCGSAMSATGDFFRVFLAAGSFSLIVGQVFLAWDLRLLQYPDQPYSRAPFLHFLAPAICAYAVLYLPLTEPISLLVWTGMMIFCILRQKRLKKTNYGPLQIENGVLECYPIILWLCLFLALSGFHIYSIVFYLMFVSIAVGIELSVGGIAIVSNINEHLPKEGARAVLARLLVALAAPFVLVIAVIGICLWIAILPGGTYILGEYALKGITIGATQFNIIQILLILSVFYLTRTVVAMGTRFLAKLPQQGTHFDATLITPMQTALTYAAWAFFGLFVLRSLGMELSNLAMVAGGLSVGIGFGMQNIVNNFISGLILIFGRTLQVGDVVEVGGTTGRVRKISVRATMVETYDNAVIYVPNSEFMAGRLINWTSFSRSVRKEVQVGVAYGSDTEEVIKLLIATANANENVLKYPVPNVNFADFSASALDFRLRFWVKDYEIAALTASQIRLAIDRVFAEHKIEISFPQLDVHIRDLPSCALKRESRPAKIARQRMRPRHGAGKNRQAPAKERSPQTS